MNERLENIRQEISDGVKSLTNSKEVYEFKKKYMDSKAGKIGQLMKEMKNPLEEWTDAYNDLKDYYDDYLTLTNLCTNPSGSLQTYSTNFSNADTDALNGYNKIRSYLDY